MGPMVQSRWFFTQPMDAIPAVGNHEFSAVNGGSQRVSIQWRPQFTLPVEKSLDPELHETVYSVDYQDVRIIVLNSNDNLGAANKIPGRSVEELYGKVENCNLPSFRILTRTWKGF